MKKVLPAPGERVMFVDPLSSDESVPRYGAIGVVLPYDHAFDRCEWLPDDPSQGAFGPIKSWLSDPAQLRIIQEYEVAWPQ